MQTHRVPSWVVSRGWSGVQACDQLAVGGASGVEFLLSLPVVPAHRARKWRLAPLALQALLGRPHAVGVGRSLREALSPTALARLNTEVLGAVGS